MGDAQSDEQTDVIKVTSVGLAGNAHSVAGKDYNHEEVGSTSSGVLGGTIAMTASPRGPRYGSKRHQRQVLLKFFSHWNGFRIELSKIGFDLTLINDEYSSCGKHEHVYIFSKDQMEEYLPCIPIDGMLKFSPRAVRKRACYIVQE